MPRAARASVSIIERSSRILIKESGLDPKFRPSQLAPLVYLVLGIRAADVDEEKAVAVVCVNPTIVDPQGGRGNISRAKASIAVRMGPRAKVRPASDRPPDIPAFSLGRYHAKRPGLTWGVRCVSQ